MNFVESSSSYSGQVGSAINVSLALNAVTGNVTYSTESGASNLDIAYDAANRKASITPNQTGNYSVVVDATDGSGKVVKKTVSLAVTDINFVAQDQSWQIGTTTQISAPAVTGLLGAAQYTYSGLPSGFTFSSTTGLVTTNSAPAAGIYPITITVADATTNRKSTGNFNLTVIPADNIAFASYDDNNATIFVGDNYNFDLSIINNVGAVSYVKNQISNPNLAGIYVDTAAHQAMVTALQPGSGTYNISATDAANRTSTSKILNLTVKTKDTPLIANVPNNLAKFTVGTAGNFTPVVTDQQTHATWNESGTVFAINKALPDGLSFDTTTGQISGTPSTLGRYAGYEISVKSSYGMSTTNAAFDIVVTNDAVMAYASGFTIYPAHANGNIVVPLTINNAVGAVTYQTNNASAGLNVTYDNAGQQMTISAGVYGSYSIFVLATDELNNTATKSVELSVVPLIVDAKSRTWTQDVTTALPAPTLTGVLGSASYAYSGLPDGLQYDQTSGVITASASPATGIYSVSVTATDSFDGTATTANFTLTVVPNGTYDFVSATDQATILTGDSHDFDLSIVNPVGTYDYTVAYMSNWNAVSYVFSVPDHKITVTGVTPGTMQIKVYARDQLGRTTGNKTLTLNIKSNDTPQIADIGNNALNLTIGTSASFTPSVTDKETTGPWSDTGTSYTLNQALPAGLTFDTTSGTISGTPTSVGIYPDYTITVTSQVGKSTTTSAFAINVVPASNIAFSDPTSSYVMHTNVQGTIGLNVSNALGNVTYTTKSSTPDGLTVAYNGNQMTVSAPVEANYTLVVTATDQLGRTTSKTFTISASLLSASMSSQSWTLGTTTQLAGPTVNALQGTASYSYAGLPTGLTFSATTGAITQTSTPTSGVYPVSVTVTDSYDGATATANFNLLVIPAANIAYANGAAIFDTIYVGDSYSYDMSVINSVGAISYNVYYVSAPGIVTYNTNSTNYTISGTALKTGSVFMHTSASDQSLRTSSTKTVYLTVKTKDTPQISDVSNNTLTYTVGTSGSFTPAVVDQQTGATWSESGTVFTLNQSLPTGLNFDSTTGTISGTASASGIYSGYTIKVTSSYGQTTTTAPFNINVVPAQAIAFTNATTTYSVHTNVAQTVSLAASNTVGTISYSTVSATNGLTVTYNTAAKQMSVQAATAGAYTVKVQVTDQVGRTSQQTFTINVVTLSVSMGSQSFTIGSSSTSSLPTVSNATGTVSYSYANLPAGLTYSTSTGQISGASTAAAGTYTATITATDSADSSTASANFSVVISQKSVSGQRCWKLTFNGTANLNAYLYEFDIFDKSLGNIWAASKYVNYTTTELANTGGMGGGRANYVTDNNDTTKALYSTAVGSYYYQINFGTDSTMYPDVTSVRLLMGTNNTSLTYTNIKVWSAPDCANDGTSVGGWTQRFTGAASTVVTSSTSYNATLSLP